MSRVEEPMTSEPGSRPSSATCRSLLERIRADDPIAWGRLVDLYVPLVFHWCRRWDLREQEIADVVQEVFQAVATHVAGFHRERPGNTFRGWLRTIAHNKVRDHFRRLGREPEGVGGTEAQLRLAQLPEREPRALDEDDSDLAETRAERRLFGLVLDQIRSEFEDRTWQAFWLTTVESRSAGDVADDLGMSPGAVRVAKSRVLRRLREELGDV
jgi:RNA polymerase sigma-70 factor (ECF subfamily)